MISDNLKKQTWDDLPSELLELILSRLIVADNIRASAVCKIWHSVATSVRVVNQSPWLMNIQKCSHWYEIYDPVQRKTHFIQFPELKDCRVCYTKEGWLLLYRCPQRYPFFFFNPFTRELIKLPRFDRTCKVEFAAFSCSPKSTGCVVFVAQDVSSTVLTISTCSPEANEWKTANYQKGSHFSYSALPQIVVFKGLFYCLSPTGWLGVFDPYDSTWSILEVLPPKCLESFSAKTCQPCEFFNEHEGHIFLIYVYFDEDPVIFKLDEALMEWKEVRTLDGAIFFISFLSCHSKTYIAGIMRNSVYFPKLLSKEKCCMSFSLDHHRYYLRENSNSRDLIELIGCDSIWIEAPEGFAGWM